MNDSNVSWEDAVLWLRDQPDQQDLVRACFFDEPLIGAADRYERSGEWAAVKAFLPETPGTALDVGAGRGISAYALAKDGWRVVALEPDPSPVVGANAIRALSNEAGLSIEVSQEWGERLPFDDSTFDLVHCRQALHHARQLDQLCSEIGRVLKPGGRLIATREHVISRKEDLPQFLADHPLHFLYAGENAYRLKEYRQAIESAGIRLVKVLNPLQSEINAFPESLQGIKVQIARRLALPFPWLIPNIALPLIGALINRPGRLYSFVGERKPHA